MERRIFNWLWNEGESIIDRGVNQQSHLLQAATRADIDGANEPLVFAALVHDLAKPLAPGVHGRAISECFPKLPVNVKRLLAVHSVFVARARGEQDETNNFYLLSWYKDAIMFGEWDAASFDARFPARPLDYFGSLLEDFL